MKRPPITSGPFDLEAGRNIKTPSGTFFLSYGRERGTSAPFFSSPTELDAIARAVSALPDLLAALERVLSRSPHIGQSDTHEGLENCDMLAACRAALLKAGYTF